MHLTWLIPTLSAIAFVVVALGGRWLPGRGAFVSIAAMAAGFGLWLVALGDMLGGGRVGCLLWRGMADGGRNYYRLGACISTAWQS